MKIWRSCIICLMPMFLTYSVMAQCVIRGRVVDGQSGEGIRGASVVVEGTRNGVASGLDGTFILKTDIEGQVAIIVTHIAYKEFRNTFILGNKNENQLGNLELEPDVIGLTDVTVTSSLAIRRKTPVALSVTDAISIERKLSTQELPEILKSSPGIYATKQGGGFGDSRVNLRGFESENVAVMINGVPMNEMEWGGIYWSNWLGLADVTRSLQVQRGLGASKVSAPSVGGSINIVTKSTEADAGGSLTYALGNDGYNKIAFQLSSGMRNGWAFSLLGAKSWGDGYVQGTDFEAYSYFVNVSKQINADHLLSFTAFGAPQEHNRRTDDLLIEEWKRQPSKYRYNAAYGFDMNGQRKTATLNKYHKPQLSLNHYWTISDKSSLSTVLYASFGRGGGYSGQGYTGSYRSKWYATNNNGGINAEFRSADGTFDYGAIYALNRESENGSLMAMGNSINDHNWYGLISTYTTQVGNYMELYGGVDLRYYKGIHTAKLIDLYGGDYFINSNDRKNVKYKAGDTEWINEKLVVGDIVYRDYDSYVLQEGVFGQLEYTKDKLASFVAASLSNSTYWRYDRFYYDKRNAESDKVHFTGFTLKGGVNYNLTDNHNLFANIGYISRAPFLADGVFLQKDVSNEVNRDAVNEKVFSVELGYGYRSPVLTTNLNAYRTMWLDKAMATSFVIEGSEERAQLNLTGVDALHQGIELDMTLKLCRSLLLTGMLSLGDWKWNNNTSGYIYDANGQPLTKDKKIASGIGADDHAKTTVNLKGVSVGNSAQTTLAFGADYQLMDELNIGAAYTHFSRNYAKFNVRGSDIVPGGEKEYQTPWKMPSAGVTDLHMSYCFPFGRIKATLFGNINNFFNKKYITDAVDGPSHDETSAQVFYGFGRTYSLRLKIEF